MPAPLRAFRCVVSPKDSGGDDVAELRHLSDGSLLCLLADGATAGGFGKLAASCFVDTMIESVSSFDPDQNPLKLIRAFELTDQRISQLPQPCETTGIALLVRDEDFILAATGDSLAIMRSGEQTTDHIELSEGQRRKPRLGKGAPAPYIRTGEVSGTIVLASDGLNMTPFQVFSLLNLAATHYEHFDPAVFLTKCASRRGLFDDLGIVVIE